MAFVLCGNLGQQLHVDLNPQGQSTSWSGTSRRRAIGSRCGLLMVSAAATSARFLKRPASWRGAGLRVAPTGEEFVDCDHRGAGDDGDGRHHENSFDHWFPTGRFKRQDARGIMFPQDERTTGAGD
jgi:hypothetical protein